MCEPVSRAHFNKTRRPHFHYSLERGFFVTAFKLPPPFFYIEKDHRFRRRLCFIATTALFLFIIYARLFGEQQARFLVGIQGPTIVFLLLSSAHSLIVHKIPVIGPKSLLAHQNYFRRKQAGNFGFTSAYDSVAFCNSSPFKSRFSITFLIPTKLSTIPPYLLNFRYSSYCNAR